MMTYTTYGSVRGCCGHRHQSAEAAQKCLDRDRRGCTTQHGYSDRRIVEVREGTLYECDGDWIPGLGGRTSGAARF